MGSQLTTDLRAGESSRQTRPIVILVPAYRCETMIVETLESIQQQGELLNEIRAVIIADDGSRDRTAAVARSTWKSPVPLVILERQFNCGEYASVNSAVEQFPPDIEWFLIMHADNIAKPGWLQTFLERIDQTTDDVGMIGSSYDSFADGGPIRPGENEPPDRVVTVTGSKAAVADTLRMGCWWHISSCAIRVAMFRKVGGLPKIMQLKGDWDFMLRVLVDGWTIEHLPRSLMLYRDNPAGSTSISFRRHMDIWETMLVIGRFHWAMSGSSLARLHAQYFWYLMRRTGGALLSLNVVRLLWVFPAMGCIIASYWSCCLDRGQQTEIVPRRRVGEHKEQYSV
jgi:glycosyltransferase involved in cell wall biosynthesis